MKTLAALLLTLASAAAFAQFETKASVCALSQSTDNAQVPGTYTASFAMVDQNGVELSASSLVIANVAPGQYSVTSASNSSQSSISQMCNFGKWLIVESPTEFGTYQQTLILSSPQSLTAASFGFDAHKLDTAGVTYQIVTRNEDASLTHSLLKTAKKPRDDQNTYQVVVISVNNVNDLNALISSASAQAIGLILERQ